jgi:hypothetical protein
MDFQWTPGVGRGNIGQEVLWGLSGAILINFDKVPFIGVVIIGVIGVGVAVVIPLGDVGGKEVGGLDSGVKGVGGCSNNERNFRDGEVGESGKKGGAHGVPYDVKKETEPFGFLGFGKRRGVGVGGSGPVIHKGEEGVDDGVSVPDHDPKQKEDAGDSRGREMGGGFGDHKELENALTQNGSCGGILGIGKDNGRRRHL